MEESQSPVVKIQSESIGLSFPDALKELIAGKQITRLDWEDKNSYGLLKNGLLMIHLKDKDYQWLVNDGDLLANDWIVIVDAN